MRKAFLVFLVIRLTTLLYVQNGSGFAQEKFGALQGAVIDETRAVLPGVRITLTHKTSDRVTSALTGAYGNYLIRNLEPGRYAVRFELRELAPVEFSEVDVLVGQTLKLDVTLKVGGVQTAVEVVDAAPMIDTQGTRVAHSVAQDEFDRLPKSRTFQYFAITAPGVNAGELEGGFQIHGASGAENVFSIDGIPTNSAIDGRSRQNAPFEFLEQIQIKTAGAEAEHGGGLGGVISAVTRSGGNDFHGSAWLYYSGSALQAAPARRLVLDPRDNRSVTFEQDDESPTHQYEPGFSLGGPLRKDTLYFFTSWNTRWDRQKQIYRFSNGAESGAIERRRTLPAGFTKLSFEPSRRIQTAFSVLWTPARATGTLPAYDAACANCLSSTSTANAVNITRGFLAPQSSYTGNVDFALSNNVLLSSHAGYFWDNYRDTGVPDITSVQYQTPANTPTVPPNLQGPVGFQNTAAIFKSRQDLIARAYGQFDAAIAGEMAGFHNLKAGFGLQKTVNNVDRYYPGGYVFIWWDRSFASPVTQRVDRGAYGYYEVNDFRTAGSTGGGIQTTYVQDQWRIRERLALNAGVRLEHERVTSFRRDIRPYAFDFGWPEKIAPRAGASYDVYGNGKLKVFGSWGRFYDWTKYAVVRAVFGGEIWRTYYRSLDTTDVFSLSLTNLPGRDLWNPGVTAFRDRRVAAAGLSSVDPNLKPMFQDQWLGGVDYQWNAHTVVGGRYIHQDLRRAVDDLAVLFQGNSAFILANPGEGIARSAPFTTGRTALPLAYPKPVRNYQAIEITARRRFSNNWFGNASYTWSRLYGNYAGLASSDEIRTPTTGVSYATSQQPGGTIANTANNRNLGWDLDEILFDSKGNFDPKGRLATDRPHVFKLNGGYERAWAARIGITSIGGFFLLSSGTPLSTKVYTTNSVPVLVNGRGDMGRTPTLSLTDLQFAHRLNLGERQIVRLELDLLNAFNQKISRHRFDGRNRGTGVSVQSSAINLANVDLRAGYDYDALIRATPDAANAYDPRYGMDDLFTEGIVARFGLKWSF